MARSLLLFSRSTILLSTLVLGACGGGGGGTGGSGGGGGGGGGSGGGGTPEFKITSNSVIQLELGKRLGGQLQVSGGTAPFGWRLVAGELPDHVSLSVQGLLTGEPVRAGTSTVTIEARDGAQRTTTARFTLEVKTPTNPLPPTIKGALPGLGPATGGSSIDVLGTSLIGVTAVEVAGRPAAGWISRNSQVLTVITPPGLATNTSRSIRVTAAGGTVTSLPIFRYYEVARGLMKDRQSFGKHYTRGVALGDLDGDGDLDMVEANDRGPGAGNFVRRNGGMGNLSLTPTQVLGNIDSNDVVLRDLDGDKDLDVVFANTGANTVWLNDGQSRFRSNGQALGKATSFGVAVGDLDGDGDADLCFANGGTESDRIYLNNGTGRFRVTTQSLGSSYSTDCEVGDLDGDGDLDLVVATLTGANLVYLNNGKATFADSGQKLGNGKTRDLVLGDLDGDGDLDLATANEAPAADLIWFNDGKGRFTKSRQLVFGRDSHAITLGDLDGDGDLDIVVGAFSKNWNHTWINKGDGSFAELTPSGMRVTNNTVDLALGDVDGDGDLDVAVANFYQQANEVYDNSGWPADHTPPTFRGLLRAEALSGSTVRLHWEPPRDDLTPTAKIGFDIFYATDAEPLVFGFPRTTATGARTSLDISGLRAGTAYRFAVRTRDRIGNRDQNTVVVRVTTKGSATPAPRISSSIVPKGAVGTTYGHTLEATGGTPPLRWTVSAGNLPDGLRLRTDGRIEGIPAAAGSGTATFRVTDARGRTDQQSFGFAILDRPAGKWSVATGSAGFSQRRLQGGIVFGGRLWLIGGETYQGGNVSAADVWSSRDGKTWTLATANAAFGPRDNFGCAVHAGHLWVLGGRKPGAGYQRDVWKSQDGITWTRVLSSAPWQARAGAALVGDFRQRLWLLGGQLRSGQRTNDVWSSRDGITWAKVNPSAPWSPRRQHAVTVFDQHMWLAAGEAGPLQNDVWRSTDGINWHRMSAKAAWPTRHSSALASHGGLLWILGGYGDAAAPARNDAWYSPDGVHWTRDTASVVWQARGGLSAVAFQGGLFVYGGARGLGNSGVRDVSVYR